MKEEKERASQVNEEIIWTEEALKRVENAPEFVQPGIRKLMVLRARERGYKVITSEFLTEIRNESMLRVSKSIKKFGFEELSMAAFDIAKKRMRRNARKIEVIGRIENFLGKRTGKNKEIMEKFKRYLEIVPEVGIPWTEEALERMGKIPTFVRGMAMKAIEEEAKKARQVVVSPFFLDQVMKKLLPAAGEGSEKRAEVAASSGGELPLSLPWDAASLERLRRIPIPFVRQRVLRQVEDYCRDRNAPRVTMDLYNEARLREP